MAVLDFLRGRRSGSPDDDDHNIPTTETTAERKAEGDVSTTGDVPPVGDVSGDNSNEDSDRLSLEARNEKEIMKHPDEVTSDAQLGVQKAEAVALIWSKKSVYGTYAWIWVCYFMLAFHSSISGTVKPKAFAKFQSAPEVATAQILATIIGGVIKLPVAKTLNLWGRAEGYIFFVIVYTIGLIILASADGTASYSAGYVLYWIGYDAIYLILDVFVADTSGLRNRAFAFAFASTPFICTAFTGPRAAESFLKTSGWPWAYGAFCIIMPIVFAPLVVIFKLFERKAKKKGLYKKVPSGRTVPQSIVHYFHEFDMIGAFFLMAGWILLLLPFSLQTNGRSSYDSASFIAMIVVGFCTLFIFAAWERYGARTHFIKYELLTQRTVLGASALAAIQFVSFYCWDLHFYNFCIVVYNLSVTNAGYMFQIFNVGSCFWGVIFGVWIRYTKRFKQTCLFFGLPLLILGAGLMIHFRGDQGKIGYVIMCQIFIAFGGGTNSIGYDMAVMASADREGVPLMLSLIGLFASLGGSIGTAVSTAIYINIFPDTLRNALPQDKQSLVQKLYKGGYPAQMEYAMGSPVREAVNFAWGQSQRYGCIAATAILVLGFPAIGVWKDYRVDRKQNKGTVI